jgi:hypothetical protein
MIRLCSLIIILFGGHIVIGETPIKGKETITELKLLTTEDRIIKVLQDSNYSLRMQQIIVAQAKHESGNFTNSLTRKYNNIFAMLHSKYDPFSKGNYGYAEGRKGYAVYDRIEESTRAYIWYTRKKKYPSDTTLVAYVDILKAKSYFTGNKKEYLNSLTIHISKDKGR